MSMGKDKDKENKKLFDKNNNDTKNIDYFLNNDEDYLIPDDDLDSDDILLNLDDVFDNDDSLSTLDGDLNGEILSDFNNNNLNKELSDPTGSASDHSFNDLGSNKKKKAKKSKSKQKHNKTLLPKGLIISICLISALVGGVFGGITSALFRHFIEPPAEETQTEDMQAGQVKGKKEQDLKTDETLAGHTEPSTNQEELESITEEDITLPNALTARDIYANSVDSVVGISGTLTINSGIWGQSKARASGSGFIISEDGYIVTNAHVINGVEDLSVTLYNQKIYPAQLIGMETGNDIAVIKISADKLKPITWGDSDTLAVGEELLVIGNPLGELTHSLTNGVVSALSRQIGNDHEVMNMFQTNAAINTGNSGGPVFNINAEVVGIATSKYASDSIEGLSFCIPVNDIKGIVNDIIKYGYAKDKPSLGITAQTVTSSMANRYKIVLGAYIVALDDNSAAAKAGIEQADVIVELNGRPVSKVSDLQGILKTLKAKQSVPITIYRNGQQKSFTIQLDEKRPSQPRTKYNNVYDL